MAQVAGGARYGYLVEELTNAIAASMFEVSHAKMHRALQFVLEAEGRKGKGGEPSSLAEVTARLRLQVARNGGPSARCRRTRRAACPPEAPSRATSSLPSLSISPPPAPPSSLGPCLFYGAETPPRGSPMETGH